MVAFFQEEELRFKRGVSMQAACHRLLPKPAHTDKELI